MGVAALLIWAPRVLVADNETLAFGRSFPHSSPMLILLTFGDQAQTPALFTLGTLGPY